MPNFFKKAREKIHGRRVRGRLPSKRSINLVTANIKRINWGVAVPLMLLVIAAVAVVSKFAVTDRYRAVDQAQQEVARLQSALAEGYAQIESFGNLQERYAHYSYAEMTQEEAERVDRVEALRLLRRMVMPRLPVDMWTISGNTMTVTVRASRLQDVNNLAQELLKEDMVDYCGVRSAATVEEQNGRSRTEEAPPEEEQVTAIIVAVLKQPEQEAGT